MAVTKLTVALDWEPNANHAGAIFPVSMPSRKYSSCEDASCAAIWLPSMRSNASPDLEWPGGHSKLSAFPSLAKPTCFQRTRKIL